MEKTNKENKNKVVNYICAAQLRLVVAASQLALSFALSFALSCPHPPTLKAALLSFFLSEPLKITSERSKML